MVSLADVTVVIPCFNSESTLPRAIESCLESGVAEVIVVDDGSLDSTSDIAKKLGVTCVVSTNQGAAKARRLGLSLVKTELVVFLDSDDFLIFDGLQNSLDVLNSHSLVPNVGVVAAYRSIVQGGQFKEIAPWGTGVNTKELLERGYSPGPPGSMVWYANAVRKSIDLDIKPLEPFYAEDFETLIRLSCIGPIATSQSIMCAYSEGTGKSSNPGFAEIGNATLIRNYYSQLLGIRILRWSSRDVRSIQLRKKALQIRKSRPLLSTLHFTKSILISPRYYVRGFLRIRRR